MGVECVCTADRLAVIISRDLKTPNWNGELQEDLDQIYFFLINLFVQKKYWVALKKNGPAKLVPFYSFLPIISVSRQLTKLLRRKFKSIVAYTKVYSQG